MAPEDTGSDGGVSTPKKVATGAAVGLATAAAVGIGKKLLGSDDSGDSEQSRSRQGKRRPQAKAKTTTKAAAGTAKRRTSSSSSSRGSRGQTGGSTRTKEQLYAQAKRLKIEGRSRMTKAQLERAVARARS